MSQTKKVLVSAFDPFGGAKVNASMKMLGMLQEKRLNGVECILLPTSYDKGFAVLQEAIDATKPDLVMSVGEAGGRSSVSLEYVAINHADCSLADNNGEIKKQCPIVVTGQNAYFATIPVFSLCQEVRDIGVPCHVSYSAGTFVCNYLMYKLLHYLDASDIRAGFVHLPWLPEVACGGQTTPTMSEDLTLRAVERMLQVLQS